jgi:acyl-CoA reductase-like NAD-dependent aldehyde dehydrogenase
MAECAANIGLPKGVLQMVNGDFAIAQQMCRHPAVKAVSFVGANHAGMEIAEECARHNKRY